MYKFDLCTMMFKSLSPSDNFFISLLLTSDLHNYSTRNNNRINIIVPQCSAIQAELNPVSRANQSVNGTGLLY